MCERTGEVKALNSEASEDLQKNLSAYTIFSVMALELYVSLQQFWACISSLVGSLHQAGSWLHRHGKERAQHSPNKTRTIAFGRLTNWAGENVSMTFTVCTWHWIFKVRGKTLPTCHKRKIRFLVLYGDTPRQSQKAYCNTILLKNVWKLHF